MSIKQNNSSVVSTCNQRLTALGKHVKAKTQMSINGAPMTLAALTGIYQACIDTRAALVPTRAALDTALSARDAAEAKRLEIDKGLKAWVVTQFGAGSTQAAEFGFSPPKIGAKTAETTFKGVAQAKATRVARGTRGKRQKEKIKGEAVVVSAAPAVPAVTNAPAAAPAASAPAATNGAPSASSSNGATASH